MKKGILAGIVALVMTCNGLAKSIDTIFGVIEEDNAIVLELIDSEAMQRLKHIDQSGPNVYFINNFIKFSRYDHSLGVYALLKKYNASLEEQIAGLLHDASHTAFSHLGDYIFQTGAKKTSSYQDSIHEWVLRHFDVEKKLATHNLSLAEVSPKKAQFTALEKDFPDMNADRIEYNLHTALLFYDLTAADIEQILTHLKFVNGKWFFVDVAAAKKFAKLSTYYNKSFWGAADNQALYAVANALLRYALQHKIIDSDDIHFGVDQEVLQKILANKSVVVQQLIRIMRNIEQYYVVSDQENDILMPVKMRGIDPLVMQNNKLYRLSDLSIDFKNELRLTQLYCKRGVPIKFVNINPEIRKLIVDYNVN